jgi:hypothetical protein
LLRLLLLRVVSVLEVLLDQCLQVRELLTHHVVQETVQGASQGFLEDLKLN